MVGPVANGWSPRPLAVIDIGTNSIFMVIARLDDAGRIELFDRHREVVRLGEGVDRSRLTDEAIRRGIDTLVRCRERADAAGAEIRAVATAAVRDAANREQFLRAARDEAGVTVEVISGEQEAQLIYVGVRCGLGLPRSRVLCCDIGGGSTELLIGEGDDIRFVRSLPLGAVGLTHRFLDGDWGSAAVEACRGYIRVLLQPVAGEVAALVPEVAVGTSGTIGAVVRMALRAEPKGSRGRNGVTLSRGAVAAAVDALVAAGSPVEAAGVPGVDPERADILLAGALILDEVMSAVGLEKLTYSTAALREGLLVDQWRRRGG